jgi:signal transduction histidine kinase
MGYAADFLSRGLRERDRLEAVEAEELYKMAKEGLAITRELARGIFPVQMDELGLSVALEDLARITSRLTGINVSLLDKGDTHVEGSEVGMHLYRIAQEAVNNAAKHSGAKNVTIRLSRTETALELVIADDGRGMPPSHRRDSGMGLHSMRYRAEVLGGTVDIQSTVGEGTTVSCQIPLRQPTPPLVAP